MTAPQRTEPGPREPQPGPARGAPGGPAPQAPPTKLGHPHEWRQRRARTLQASLGLNLDGILIITAISTTTPLPPRGEIVPKINTNASTAKLRVDNRSGEGRTEKQNGASQSPRTAVSGCPQFRRLPHRRFCWSNPTQQHLGRIDFGPRCPFPGPQEVSDDSKYPSLVCLRHPHLRGWPVSSRSTPWPVQRFPSEKW